jgi:uncharacterized protein (DUF433 family)
MEHRHRVVVLSTKSGSEPTIAGTGVPVRTLLNFMALGHSWDELLGGSRFTRVGQSGRDLEPADISAALSYAAAIANAKRLRPPTRAAFAESRLLSGLTIENVEAQASAVLAELGDTEQTWPPGNESAADLSRAAAAYAAKLIGQESKRTFSEGFGNPIGVPLPPSDQRLLQEFYEYRIALGGPEDLSPDKLFERWKQLVEMTERGYFDVYDEYANALDGRDLLEDSISMVSPSSRRTLLEIVDPWDRRFAGATRESHSSLRRLSRWRPLRWWWYRVPHDVGPLFEKYLEELGLSRKPS